MMPLLHYCKNGSEKANARNDKPEPGTTRTFIC